MGYIKRAAVAKYEGHQSTNFLLSNRINIALETMVRVAVAGGTSGLGLLVVKAIVATKKHNVFVLSRKVINRTFATSYHKH